MRRIYLGVVASVLITAPSVTFAEKGEEQATEETKANDNANKMRCKRIQVTGSLIKKRLCRTNAEWAEIASSGNREARGMVDHANQGVTNGR